jgi:nucleoside-diphosphate-sugar epimerase
MAEALRRAAGDNAYKRIAWRPDATIQAIVGSWPRQLAAPRAEALGFQPDAGIDEAVRFFIEDDLAMQQALVG